jgi:hypothetical protein
VRGQSVTGMHVTGCGARVDVGVGTGLAREPCCARGCGSGRITHSTRSTAGTARPRTGIYATPARVPWSAGCRRS